MLDENRNLLSWLKDTTEGISFIFKDLIWFKVLALMMVKSVLPYTKQPE